MITTMIRQPPLIKSIMIIKMSSTIRAYLTNIDFNLAVWLYILIIPGTTNNITISDALPFQPNTFNDQMDENNLQTERY